MGEFLSRQRIEESFGVDTSAMAYSGPSPRSDCDYEGKITESEGEGQPEKTLPSFIILSDRCNLLLGNRQRPEIFFRERAEQRIPGRDLSLKGVSIRHSNRFVSTTYDI